MLTSFLVLELFPLLFNKTYEDFFMMVIATKLSEVLKSQIMFNHFTSCTGF